jgi:hypothetical protein
MKISKIFIKASQLFSLVSLLTISSVSFAGLDMNTAGQCSQTDNIVTCNGTMAAIRKQTADSGRHAFFYKAQVEPGVTWMLFYQQFNNKIYMCSPPGTQEWRDMWDTAMMSNAWYEVKYYANTGVCMDVRITNGSAFKNASAL